jgi:predicted flap endonuclease-1-like 5' DNA nuclease
MLWWIVLGALLGWVGAWWLGRSTQRLLTEPVVRLVERRLDNPQHVARIAALEGELAALRAEAATIPALRERIEALQSAPPQVVEKVVTRTVDRVVEKPVERVVERLVERTVPDVAAIAARDAALRAQRQRVEHLDALAAVLAARVADAPGAAADAGDTRAVAAPAATQAAVARTAPGTLPGTAPSPAGDDATRPLRARIEHLEALAAVQAQRLADARDAAQAGTRARPVPGEGDIEVVEGIGPRIAELLRARGLGSFGALAQASPGTLREILDDNGPAYRIADPSTWPEQARLAADGRWDELRSLQDSLTAGRR